MRIKYTTGKIIEEHDYELKLQITAEHPDHPRIGIAFYVSPPIAFNINHLVQEGIEAIERRIKETHTESNQGPDCE